MPDVQRTQDAGLQSLKRPGSIMRRTAKGAGWAIFWRLANRALGLASTLVLVRLLSPADFGVVTLAMSFAEGLLTLGELGIESAIIRDDMPDRVLYDTGFTINVLRGLGVAGIILVIAYPAAHFFHNPHFVTAIVFAAAVNAVGAFENIGVVDFRRFLVFEQEFRLKIIPRIVSVVVAITLAFVFRSFVALLFAILLGRCVGTWLSYRMHPYRPRFTLAGWNRIASYSTLLWLSNISRLLQGLSVNVAVGRIIGTGAVGIYGVGAEIAGLPSSELVAPLTRAAFPGFAEARSTAEGQGQMLLRLVGVMAMLTLPAAVGLSLIADPLVRLAFGNRWLAAVPIVQIAGVAEAFTIFGLVSRTLFAVQAWTKAIFKVSVAVLGAQIVLLIVLLPRYGLVGAVLASAMPGTVGQFIYFAMAAHRLSLSMRLIAACLWRSVIACMSMSWFLFASGLAWNDAGGLDSILAIHLLKTISLGAGIYVVTLLGLWYAAGRPIGPESDVLSLACQLRCGAGRSSVS